MFVDEGKLGQYHQAVMNMNIKKINAIYFTCGQCYHGVGYFCDSLTCQFFQYKHQCSSTDTKNNTERKWYKKS